MSRWVQFCISILYTSVYFLNDTKNKNQYKFRITSVLIILFIAIFDILRFLNYCITYTVIHNLITQFTTSSLTNTIIHFLQICHVSPVYKIKLKFFGQSLPLTSFLYSVIPLLENLFFNIFEVDTDMSL